MTEKQNLSNMIFYSWVSLANLIAAYNVDNIFLGMIGMTVFAIAGMLIFIESNKIDEEQ